VSGCRSGCPGAGFHSRIVLSSLSLVATILLSGLNATLVAVL
jgi:hypothetical protein